MGEQTGALIAYAGLSAFVTGLIILFWPWRREWRFTLRRLIAAPRERVWDTYQVDLDDPETAAFHDNIVSVRTLHHGPEIREEVIDTSGGHGTHLTTVRSQTLTAHRPELYATRICDVDGKPFPFGPRAAETLELLEHPGGTLAALSWRGKTATLWQIFSIWLVVRRYLHRLRRFCESGADAPKPRLGRSFWTSLVLSALAVATFALWLGWTGALVLAGILVVHEFGHWFAMRLTGQPAPRMTLVPFFGGVAVANHPHKSLFDDAFCALMGPGFSVLPCLALLLAGLTLGLPEPNVDWTDDIGRYFTVQEVLANALVGLAALVGIVNAFQLLPLLPLDGGQVLRTLVQSLNATWARPVLLGLAGLAMTSLAFAGDFILAGVLGVGALQAWHMKPGASKARPMGAPGLCVICLGYLLTSAVHVGAAYYGLQLIGLELF